jgi:hypothetical protein
MSQMTLYVLRNKATGEYWRRGAAYGARGQWETELTGAQFLTTPGKARGQQKRLGSLGIQTEIVALSATVTGIVE